MYDGVFGGWHHAVSHSASPLLRGRLFVAMGSPRRERTPDPCVFRRTKGADIHHAAFGSLPNCPRAPRSPPFIPPGDCRTTSHSLSCRVGRGFLFLTPAPLPTATGGPLYSTQRRGCIPPTTRFVFLQFEALSGINHVLDRELDVLGAGNLRSGDHSRFAGAGSGGECYRGRVTLCTTSQSCLTCTRRCCPHSKIRPREARETSRARTRAHAICLGPNF